VVYLFFILVLNVRAVDMMGKEEFSKCTG